MIFYMNILMIRYIRKEIELLKANKDMEIIYMIQNHVLNHIQYCYLDNRTQLYLDELCNINCEGLCFFDMGGSIDKRKRESSIYAFYVKKRTKSIKRNNISSFSLLNHI